MVGVFLDTVLVEEGEGAQETLGDQQVHTLVSQSMHHSTVHQQLLDDELIHKYIVFILLPLITYNPNYVKWLLL